MNLHDIIKVKKDKNNEIKSEYDQNHPFNKPQSKLSSFMKK